MAIRRTPTYTEKPAVVDPVSGRVISTGATSVTDPISGRVLNVGTTPTDYNTGGTVGSSWGNIAGNVIPNANTSGVTPTGSRYTNPEWQRVHQSQLPGYVPPQGGRIPGVSPTTPKVTTPAWAGNATDYASLMSGLNSLNPGDINIDSTATGFTNTILSDYGRNTANALQYLQQAGQAGVSGYQGVLNTLQGGVSDYLRNINQGAQAELGGIGGTLGYYQTLANRNQLPGQNIMEQNVQANTAGALNKVREFGGTSQGALGAITNLYGQQQAGMRDIGLGAANYQAQNQANLANYMGTVGAQRAGVYNRMGEAAMTGAQTTATGQQMLTQAQQNASGDVANYYAGLAPQSANILSGLMQQRLNAEQQQADLARRSILDVASTVGQGLSTASQYQDQSYYYNQLMPYQNATNFYNAMMGVGGQSSDLTNTAMNMYNTNASLYNQGQQGWTNAAATGAGTILNFLGQYILNR